MMKKSLIALAVGTAVAAPAAHAVDFEMGDTKFSVGGTLEPSFESFNDASGDSVSQFTDNDSTLEFDFEHVLDDNLSAYGHIEYEFNFDESGSNAGGLDDLDSAELGFVGNFGTVQLGTYDTLYEDELAELLDEFENAEVSDEADGDDGSGEGNQITYWSPGYGDGGFSFAAEIKHEGEAEGTVAGDSGTGITLVGRFDMDNWGIVVGNDDRGAATAGGDFVEENTTGIGGYYTINDFEIRARYADEANPGNNSDVEYVGVLGSYDYGPGSFNVAVQDVSPDQGNSFTELAANVKHDLYDNLRVFFEIGQFDRQNDAGDRVELGAIYSW
ncbi:MAG: porin [Halofilum sp. (in: g-proteobacteria)]|nr:porin [Halofilum sp. (in: g-proteobacteria)]